MCDFSGDIRILKKAQFKAPKNFVAEFKKLRDRLIALAEDPNERRSFLYFDLIS